MFILKHQDGDVYYELKSGGFCIEHSELFLSIEATAKSPDDFPERFLFALRSSFSESTPKKLVINTNFHESTDFQEVFVYTTFHASEIAAHVSLAFESGETAAVEFDVISDDVNYYDNRAKPNRFTGTAVLHKTKRGDLWLPS